MDMLHMGDYRCIENLNGTQNSIQFSHFVGICFRPRSSIAGCIQNFCFMNWKLLDRVIAVMHS